MANGFDQEPPEDGVTPEEIREHVASTLTLVEALSALVLKNFALLPTHLRNNERLRHYYDLIGASGQFHKSVTPELQQLIDDACAGHRVEKQADNTEIASAVPALLDAVADWEDVTERLYRQVGFDEVDEALREMDEALHPPTSKLYTKLYRARLRAVQSEQG